MFDLVADVEAYPQFVPFCDNLIVRSRRKKGERELITADMTVGYKLLRETFTSRITLDAPKLTIDVEAANGPFRHLANCWRFVEMADGGSEVCFDLDYEFRSRALAMVMGAMFEKIFARYTGAFERRADELYGRA